MKYVKCIKSDSRFLTEGKIYPAITSSYPHIDEYYVSDDSLKQKWYSKSLFIDVPEEEVKALKTS
jgi:hypothetical protein